MSTAGKVTVISVMAMYWGLSFSGSSLALPGAVAAVIGAVVWPVAAALWLFTPDKIGR